MYYIIRIELGTPEIRAKYNLPLGSTTVYSISMGQGVNKNWVYSPFIVTGGKYEMTDDKNFKFSAQSPKGSLVLESTDIIGGFKVNMSWDKYSSVTTFQPEQPIAPSFNGENGCAPCVAGAGTLYWSYTQLPSSSTIKGINIDGKSSHEFTSGDGWLDRQWLRGNDTKQLFVTILTNIKQLSTATGGLGRYIWINIHLKDGTQYMISAFPDPNKTVQAGTTYPARFNIYSEKHAKPLWNQDTKLTIKKTKVVDGVTFPIENEIEVRDFDGKSHTYTIDATMYGDCVTLDLTGNLHWSGSAELIGCDGTAFLEANQFEEAKDYQLTMMKIAGIPANQQSVFNKGPLTFWQVLPSITMLVIPVILFIAIIVFVVKGVRSKHATFKR